MDIMESASTAAETVAAKPAENDLFYGQNKLLHSSIIFDRSCLNNPNGFKFGEPSSGMGFVVRQETADILSKAGEILMLNPKREYTTIDESFDSEKAIQR